MGNKLFGFIIVAFVIMSFVCLGFAQNNPVKFGLRGGLNLANSSEDIGGGSETVDLDGVPVTIEYDQKMRNTFGFGGFAEFWVSPMFAIQANALYSMKGAKAKADIDETINFQGFTIDINGSAEQTIKLSYLSFPIMGKIAFGENGAVKPYILAGPEIGILLSAKLQNSVDITGSANGVSETVSASDEMDIKDEAESLEFALNFGGGVIIPLGSTELFIDGRYGLGLTKVNKEGDVDLKNNVIYINVGLIFGGK